jgi:hypothetical protein
MDQIFTKLAEQAAVIKAAPYPFILAVLIAAGAIWVAFNWAYGSILSNKNAQIELLQGRIADYQDKLKGASPDQAADEIKHLRSEIDSIKNPARDDNSVYQKGNKIGVVGDVKMNIPNKSVIFGQMTIVGELDQATNVEFRNLVLTFTGVDAIGVARQGLAVTSTYSNARFSIIGNRN